MDKKVKYSELINNKECLFRYRSCNEDSSKIVGEIIGSLNAGMDDYIKKNEFMLQLML